MLKTTCVEIDRHEHEVIYDLSLEHFVEVNNDMFQQTRNKLDRHETHFTAERAINTQNTISYLANKLAWANFIIIPYGHFESTATKLQREKKIISV